MKFKLPLLMTMVVVLTAVAVFWILFRPLYSVQQGSSADAAYNADEMFIGIERWSSSWKGNQLQAAILRFTSAPTGEKLRSDYLIWHVKNGRLSEFSFPDAPYSNLTLYQGQVFLKKYNRKRKQDEFWRWSDNDFVKVANQESEKIFLSIGNRGWYAFKDSKDWTHLSGGDILTTARDSTQLALNVNDHPYKLMMRQYVYGSNGFWERYVLSGYGIAPSKQELLYIDKTISTFVSGRTYQKYAHPD